MKLLWLALITTFCTQAWSRDIPDIADIDWKCEEGVGNLQNPAPLLNISGKFDTARSRQFTELEKNALQVTVFRDGVPVVLKSSEFEITWENDGEFQSLTVQTKDATYKIGTTPGNALIMTITTEGWFGPKTEVGSC